MEQSFCGWLSKAFLVSKFPDMKYESFLYNNMEHSLRKKKEHTHTLFFFSCQYSWVCYSADAVLNWILCPSLLKCEVCRSQSIHFRAVS